MFISRKCSRYLTNQTVYLKIFSTNFIHPKVSWQHNYVNSYRIKERVSVGNMIMFPSAFWCLKIEKVGIWVPMRLRLDMLLLDISQMLNDLLLSKWENYFQSFATSMKLYLPSLVKTIQNRQIQYAAFRLFSWLFFFRLQQICTKHSNTETTLVIINKCKISRP